MTALDFLTKSPEIPTSYACKSRFARMNWSVRSRRRGGRCGHRQVPSAALWGSFCRRQGPADSPARLPALPCATTPGTALIGRRVTRRERNRETAHQALGAPVEFGLPAELRLDAGDHAPCAETARRRFLDPRPAGLLPSMSRSLPRSPSSPTSRPDASTARHISPHW